FDQKTPPVTILHDLAGGEEKVILAEGRIRAQSIHWAPDNAGFYVSTAFSSHPRFVTASISVVYYYELAAGKAQQVDLDWPNGASFGFATVPGGFVAMLAAGSRPQPAWYEKSGGSGAFRWQRHALEGEHARNMESFEVSEDGKTIV